MTRPPFFGTGRFSSRYHTGIRIESVCQLIVSLIDVKMRISPWAAIILVSTLALAYGQQDDCGAQQTCRDCIRTPKCTWCSIVSDANATNQPVRCVSEHQAERSDWCTPENRVNPKTRAKISQKNGNEEVQMQPQLVKLQLRRGEEYRLKVRYRQAKDYPVDLYFLVDLSGSMYRFLKDLGELTGQIEAAMLDLTSDFQLGFGSFIDKTVGPMVYSGPQWDWREHYSFINHLRLTHERERFKGTVQGTPVRITYDVPEGGLDGMMQAIVCKEEIGWRSNARHLLVHASDATPHISGDGRLAGIVKPNDEKCHLEKNSYTDALLRDYPSLGQINHQARKNNINIIFATVNRYKTTYESVQNVVQDSAVGTFDLGSRSVVPLISKHYEKLVNTLKMTSNSTSKFLDIKFFSRCLDRTGELQRTDKCDGIRVNLTVEFEVVIKATDCPELEEDWHQTIEIKPDGINESTIVHIELLCGCECSKKRNKGKDAPREAVCNSHGILDCGICSCDHGHFGKWCQCEGSQDVANTDELLENCRKDNASKICSGRGSCICGSCSCNEVGNTGQRYYKQFCQCDNISCRYSRDGKLCGGHGHCDCGNCMCDPGWEGETCECKDDRSLCLPPGDNAKVCSGAGRCECGRCKCDEAKGRRGRFCEDCLSCPGQRCDEFKDCVECVVHKSGKIYAEDHNCFQCSKINVTKVDAIEEIPKNDESEVQHVCRIAGDDGSTFVFKYVYPNGEDKDAVIIAPKDKEFRPIDDFLAATLGVVFLTLLLGFLILLIWKILTHLHDRREYEKFTKESSGVHFGQGQNPLYKEAVATFKNPTFDSDPGEQVVWSHQ